MAIGRISGEMLEQNLNLTGNLTFNGDALTIASDGKIGIKNTTPGVELDVTGTARANTVTVLGDLSMEWTITMDAQDNLNFAYNGNTLIAYDNNGNISGNLTVNSITSPNLTVETENPELKLIDNSGSSGGVRYKHESETIAYQTWTITSEEYPAGFGFYQNTLNFLNNPEPNFFAYKTLANNPNVNYLYIKGVNKSSLISSSQASTLTSGGTITLTENETTYVVTSGGATPSEYINHLFTTNGSNYTETTKLYPTEVQIISNVLFLESDKENISNYSEIQFKVDGDKKVSIDSFGNLNAYNNLSVAGTTTIDGDVTVNSDQITISSGGTGTNTTPYLILNSLAEGTSFPVTQAQPAGGVKWTHNGSELASVELSTGVLNNLEINCAAEINMSADTNVTGNLSVSNKIIANSLQSYFMQEYVFAVTTGYTYVTASISATGAVVYMTADMTGDTTTNVRGDGSTTVNDLLAVNETVTVVFLFTNGTTAYINNVFQIDTAPQTVKWNGGSAPTAGTANAIDVYSYTIIKTAANTYTVLGSFSSFA